MKRILRKIYRLWVKAIWQNAKLSSGQFYDRNDGRFEASRRFEDPVFLERFGYKVYSQNDEDGIIAEIFRRIGTTNKTFVEFGVQNGLESNGHYLLHQGWNGLWIEGNKKFYKQVCSLFSGPIQCGQLKVLHAFITKDNINALISGKANLSGDIDLLSIDIDGNDYWIWEAIDCIRPRVVVIEYNAKFPPPHQWIMDYNPSHTWDGSDNHGASLKSLELSGRNSGYQLVGTNLNGVNAFFVNEKEAEDLFPQPATAENLYNSWGMRRYSSSGHSCKRYTGKTISSYHTTGKNKTDTLQVSHLQKTGML